MGQRFHLLINHTKQWFLMDLRVVSTMAWEFSILNSAILLDLTKNEYHPWTIVCAEKEDETAYCFRGIHCAYDVYNGHTVSTLAFLHKSCNLVRRSQNLHKMDRHSSNCCERWRIDLFRSSSTLHISTVKLIVIRKSVVNQTPNRNILYNLSFLW